MDEARWLASDDPAQMLNYLVRRNYVTGTTAGEKMGNRISSRKLRLFCVACCRLTDDVRRESADRWEKTGLIDMSDKDWARNWAGPLIASVPAATRVALLREIVGNPFRKPRLPKDIKVRCENCSGRGWLANTADTTGPIYLSCFCTGGMRAVGCSWLTWNDGIVPRLAQAIYDERSWDRMPILADALEEAGCGDDEILNHCRTGQNGWTPMNAYGESFPVTGPHVRGWWVLDLLLGKE
jgi:hypothetical protein